MTYALLPSLACLLLNCTLCPQAILFLGSGLPPILDGLTVGWAGRTLRVLPLACQGLSSLAPTVKGNQRGIRERKRYSKGTRDEGTSREWAGVFWPTSVRGRARACPPPEGSGRNKGGGYWGPLTVHSPAFSPLSSPPPTLPLPMTPSLTYLMAQHALQPVLPSSSQVDGQCGSAVLHHHHSLRQQVLTQLHHNLQVAV